MSDLEKYFCIVPWVEVHINADGSYHTCGTQPIPLLTNENNIKNMSIEEWVNSTSQNATRLLKSQGLYEPACDSCMREDVSNGISKRTRENLKSNIDLINFYPTFNQSPDLKYFEYSRENNGQSNYPKPNSFHFSLGNECNLACRMCGPGCSSSLATKLKKEEGYTGPIGINWTSDDNAWNHLVDYMCANENLEFVHVIGGEPFMNPRFEELIDRLITAGKTDIRYFGFTTNGTRINQSIIEKLNQFRYVDIGVSIECGGELNDMTRRGSSYQTVLDNIDLYLQYKKPTMNIVVRPVPSALTVHTIDELFKWCVSRQIDVMSNIIGNPVHLRINQLPPSIKSRLIDQLMQWEFSELPTERAHPRDASRFKEHIDNEVKSIINALRQDNDPAQTEILYQKLQSWGWLDNERINHFFIT